MSANRYILREVYVKVMDEQKLHTGYFVHVYDQFTKKCIEADNSMLGLPADFLKEEHFNNILYYAPDGESYAIMQYDHQVLATKERMNFEEEIYANEIVSYVNGYYSE
jgi:hypothetical protein